MPRGNSNKKYEGLCPTHGGTWNHDCLHCKAMWSRHRRLSRASTGEPPSYLNHNGIGLRMKSFQPGEPYGIINLRWRTPAQLEKDIEREIDQAPSTQHEAHNGADSQAAVG